MRVRSTQNFGDLNSIKFNKFVESRYALFMFQRVYEPLDSHLQPNKVLVIYGPRRVGKTTLLTRFLAGTSLNAPKSWLSAYPEASFAVIHPENYLDFVLPAPRSEAWLSGTGRKKPVPMTSTSSSFIGKGVSTKGSTALTWCWWTRASMIGDRVKTGHGTGVVVVVDGEKYLVALDGGAAQLWEKAWAMRKA